MCVYVYATIKSVHAFASAYLCFGLADMLLLKEKLTVQITDIDGVQVNLKKTKQNKQTSKIKIFLVESIYF